MNQYRENNFIIFLSIVLVVALITPSIVKVSHVFADHEHVVCSSVDAEHLHEINLDCEFYKFKISSDYFFNLDHDSTVAVLLIDQNIVSQYSFVSDFQKLPFALRGPPILV